MSDPDTKLANLSFGLSGLAPGVAGTVIPAVSGKRISVHSINFAVQITGGAFAECGFIETSSAGATISFQQGSSVYVPAYNNGGLNILPWQQWPYFTCASGNALSFVAFFNTIAIAGNVSYVQA